MNLLFRLIWVIIGAFFRPKLSGLEPSHLSLHVWPNDLDINIHMNNARYLSVMDLGRVDMIVRLGVLKELRKRGWYPVVGAINITYRKSLELFERFDIITEVVGWDEKWVYMTQRIERNGVDIAHASMKTLFMSKNGRVSNDEVIEIMGHIGPSPEIPRHIRTALQRDPEA